MIGKLQPAVVGLLLPFSIEMGSSSSVLNESRKKLRNEGKQLLDKFVEDCVCKELGNDEMQALVTAKVEELLRDYPVPIIQLINFDKIVALNSFPRCPNNYDLATPLNEIDRNNSLLVFISHCWMRGYSGAEGWDGRPHPDNADGDKYKMCVKGINKLKATFAPRMKECYVWLDFGCINQDGNPAGELEQLDKIVECCDCIFTPIVDHDHDIWDYPTTITNFLVDYKAKLWNDGPHAYLNRGWCRVEMLYAANIPVLENDESSGVKRHTLFDAGLAFHCSNNRRPHFLYGSKEYRGVNVFPIMLPPLQNSYLANYHPLKGNLSVSSDVEHIEALVSELQPYLDANTTTEGYKGDRNAEGRWEGHGVYRYESGSYYEGEFKNGNMHGIGSLYIIDGDVYEGEWKDDKMHGKGTYRYASGTVYQGAWENGDKNGFGKYWTTDGYTYEGMYKNDFKHGRGIYHFPLGDVYDGEWVNDEMEGSGTFTYADGTVDKGPWRKGKKVEEVRTQEVVSK